MFATPVHWAPPSHVRCRCIGVPRAWSCSLFAPPSLLELADISLSQYLSHTNHLLTAPVVLPLCTGGAQLIALAEKLTAEGVAHKLWIEQPEGIPTSIALKPYPKSFVAPLLKKYSLFK